MIQAKPIGDKIIVKLNKVQETLNSGIFVPKSLQSDYLEHRGVVVSVGNSVKHCKIGDMVQKFYAVEGISYEENEIEYVIFKESRDIEFVNEKLI